MSKTSNFRSVYSIILLILAGESVFFLPFVIVRVFRPTYLDVFQITNTELGTCTALYGIVALISYLFGGLIADKIKPGRLMAIALLLTSMGGFYLATYPSLSNLKILYGYWGFTTIFLFWSAMIKATRKWGGKDNQGKAFGFLEGGRGLLAGLIGTAGVLIYSIIITEDIEVATLAERQNAFKSVILFTSGFITLISVLIWFGLNENNQGKTEIVDKLEFKNLIQVLKIPTVWTLMIIILCAYVGYKLTDIFSLYAKEVMGFDEIKSAKIGTFLLYLRPIAAVSFGLLADKFKSSKLMIIGFAIVGIGSIIFSSGYLNADVYFIFILSCFVTGLGIYAIRALYFAAMEEGNIPFALTGTAVGVISFIGYTPDIFVGPVMGVLLDNNPGEYGHQLVFIMLGIFSFIGLLASVLFVYFSKSKKNIV